jgi:hypothetical protein
LLAQRDRCSGVVEADGEQLHVGADGSVSLHYSAMRGDIRAQHLVRRTSPAGKVVQKTGSDPFFRAVFTSTTIKKTGLTLMPLS